MNLLYPVLRGWARSGLWLFASRVIIERPPGAAYSRPTILASNHPNSFLDAILLGVFHPRPLYFLARGDAFRKPLAARVLRAMGLIPIHRISEGREHLHRNDETFQECLAILRGGGTVLIFSEGLSEHGYNLRPLRKGTARLVWMAWHEAGLPGVVVQPVRLWYHSFRSRPKRIAIWYAPPISALEVPAADGPSHFYKVFNAELGARLEDSRPAGAAQERRRAHWLRMGLLPFAAAGAISQGWFYLLVRRFAARRTRGTVFYDSVLFGLLLVTYPVLLAAAATTAGLLGGPVWGFGMLLLLPALAWCLKAWVGAADR